MTISIKDIYDPFFLKYCDSYFSTFELTREKIILHEGTIPFSMTGIVLWLLKRPIFNGIHIWDSDGQNSIKITVVKGGRIGVFMNYKLVRTRLIKIHPEDNMEVCINKISLIINKYIDKKKKIYLKFMNFFTPYIGIRLLKYNSWLLYENSGPLIKVIASNYINKYENNQSEITNSKYFIHLSPTQIIIIPIKYYRSLLNYYLLFNHLY